MFDWLIHWFVYSLIHSFIDSFFSWFNDLFIDSFIIHWLIHSFIHSVIYSFIHSFIDLFIDWLIDWLIDRLKSLADHFRQYIPMRVELLWFQVRLCVQVPLNGSFRQAFRNVRSVIVDKLDVSHGLIDVLGSYGVLTNAHVADIAVSIPLWCLTVEFRLSSALSDVVQLT